MSEETVDPIVEEANKAIVEVLKEMRAFLLEKNRCYQGSAFKDISFGGKVIDADTTINVRMTDKLRRLQSSSLSFESFSDTLDDLAGYIIIKRALAKLRKS
jgi:hypothetical protein